MDPLLIYLAMFMSAVIFTLGLWLNVDGKKRQGIGLFERMIALWFMLAGAGGLVCLLVILAAALAGIPLDELP